MVQHVSDELRAGGNKTPTIAVVGSCVMDDIYIGERNPGPGETVFADHWEMGFGGKGANQAVAAARCGAKVHMVGCVGEDPNGHATLRNLAEQDIDVRHVHALPGEKTAMAGILVDAKGQNCITVFPGANRRLSPEIVDKAKPMLEKVSGIIMQHEIPLETVYHTIAFGKEKGIKTFFNPSPVPGPKDGFDLKKLDGLDYLVVNEHEAQAISGMKVETAEDAEKSAKHLLDNTGIKKVIVTLGKNGAVLAGRDGMQHVPAFKVDVVSTVGAGDAFLGSFATFIGQGMDEAEALSRANLYAGLSTTKHGTQVSYPERAAFELQWSARNRDPVARAQ